MELTLNKNYLLLPVTTGAEMRNVKMVIDGQTVRDFDIELPDGEPEFWIFMDVTMFAGKTATLEGPCPECAEALATARLSDEIDGAAEMYKEKYRPQFHFSSRRGWNNDPNGMVFYDGEYHLFYQHNPYGRGWGNMHWGQAVSTDMVHWTELPVALYPDELGTIFSGSAVVDEANTTGFATGDEKPIVAAYTYAGDPFTQGLAFSNDRGRTWTKFEGNPVLPNITGGSDRDPRILWHEPTNQWVMALFLDEPEKPRIGFFTSPDLKTWTQTSEGPVFFECPDLFELSVDGDDSNKRWVVYGGAGDYDVGQFDGKQFTSDQDHLPLNQGSCYYAAQTFSNIPAADGRRIQIGWGQSDPVGMPFNQMMLFPVELTLRTVDDKIVMFAYPVCEIEKLHGKKRAWEGLTIDGGDDPLEDIRGDLFDIALDITPGDASCITVKVRGVEVACDISAGTLSCLHKTAPLPMTDGAIHLRLLVDRTSIEIFAGDGQVYMPMAVIPEDDDKSLALQVAGGKATVNSLTVFELNSAWK